MDAWMGSAEPQPRHGGVLAYLWGTLVPRASRSEPLLVKVRKAASSMFGMP